MRHALDGDRFDGGIGHDHFFVAGGSRVAFVSGVDVGPKHLPEPPKLDHEPIQNFLRFLVRRSGLEVIKAFRNLRLHSDVQALDPAPRHIRQIAGIDQRRAVKSRKHQAHQVDAG
jgi:hypothetical protein